MALAPCGEDKAVPFRVQWDLQQLWLQSPMGAGEVGRGGPRAEGGPLQSFGASCQEQESAREGSQGEHRVP